MQTTTIPGALAAPPERSTWGLIQLALFWLATNFHWAAIPIIILPSQVEVFLFTHHPAGLSGDALATYIKNNAPGDLALIVGPGLVVALLANPLFGALSDRTRLRWGRRRPFILFGTLVNILGLGVMAYAPNLTVLILGLMVVQLANNCAAAPFHALLPDLVPPQQRGRASGWMGLGQMLGTILGATIPGIVLGINAGAVIAGTESLAAYQGTILAAYGFTAAFVGILAVITVVVVREPPPERRVAPELDPTAMRRLARDLVLTVLAIAAAIALTIGVLLAARANLGDATAQNVLILPAVLVGSIGVARAFDFRPRQHRDFAWVLVTRAIVMMGIYTVLSFLQLYLRYVTFAGIRGAPKAEDAAAYFIDIVIVMAGVSTAFAGALSDRIGRKRMVYLSGAFMVAVGIIFLLTPVLAPQFSVIATFINAAIFGLGYGAYVSVDWALVTDVLPNEAHFARDMGIWNVALTTPQVLSYVVGAFVIVAFNAGGPLAIPGQATFGYTMLLILLVVYATVGTVTVRNIRGVIR